MLPARRPQSGPGGKEIGACRLASPSDRGLTQTITGTYPTPEAVCQ